MTTASPTADTVNSIEHDSATVSATEQHVSHEATLFAEPIFTIQNFTVTNALLTSWVAVGCIIILSLLIRRKIQTVPRGIQNVAEALLSGATNLADSITGSPEKTARFMPIVFPLFVFILINNWLGLLPGVGTIGFIETHGQESAFVPLFRGGTADLNLTLALAIVTVVLTHIFGVIATGAWSHLNRFVSFNVLLEIPKEIFVKKNFAAILINPIKFFVGLIETVGELAKVASLSFRLFGNIFAGEVLLGTMAALFAYILPTPFMFLEVMVGFIQAMIFAILVLMFLTVLTTEHEHEASPSH